MKYCKALPVNGDTLNHIAKGKFKIQIGQYIQLSWSDTPSRFVGVKNGIIWAQHSYKNAKGKTVFDGGETRFLKMVESFKRSK